MSDPTIATMARKARELAGTYSRGLKHLDVKDRRVAMKLSGDLEKLASYHEQLAAGVSVETVSQSMKAAGFSNLVRENSTREMLESAVNYTLQDTLQKASSHELLSRVNIDTALADQAKKMNFGGEKSSGFFGKTGDKIAAKHKKWLSGKSETTRLVLANTEIFAGSFMMLQGAIWTMQSFKNTEIQPTYGEKGLELRAEAVPVPRRLRGAALGLITAAAGLGMTALGFSALRK